MRSAFRDRHSQIGNYICVVSALYCRNVDGDALSVPHLRRSLKYVTVPNRIVRFYGANTYNLYNSTAQSFLIIPRRSQRTLIILLL